MVKLTGLTAATGFFGPPTCLADSAVTVGYPTAMDEETASRRRGRMCALSRSVWPVVWMLAACIGGSDATGPDAGSPQDGEGWVEAEPGDGDSAPGDGDGDGSGDGDIGDGDGDTDSAADCAMDGCGVCDDDPGNDCVRDCAAQWGGDATADACGVCDDDPTNDCLVLRALSSGMFHTCGLRMDGQAVCWGANDDGQSSPPTGGAYTEIASGSRHTCAVRLRDGRVVCWGDNAHGQTEPPLFDLVGLTAGVDHTCGIWPDNGVAMCWGNGNDGRTAAPEGVAFATIAAGHYHNCGIRSEDGEVQCWGNDIAGQASDIPLGFGFESIFAGVRHTCALRSATNPYIRCWGADQDAVGNQAPYLEQMLSGSAGEDTSCTLRTSDRTAYCWGAMQFPNYGQDGPPQVPMSTISMGTLHGCGLTLDGGVLCWGDNGIGQAQPPQGG